MKNLKISITIIAILFSACALFALPQGEQVEQGAATFEHPDQNTLKITADNNTVINFDSFSIAQNEAVNFIQPSSAAMVLSRVIGNEPSIIAGSLTANGTLFLVNTNGINITSSANINVNNFIASTLDISTQNFITGNYEFMRSHDAQYAELLNEGRIEGGNIALMGSSVHNGGIIIAKAGTVHLAAGDKTTVAFDARGLISIEVNENTTGKVMDVKTGETVKDQISSSGVIEAHQVMMTAKTAEDIFENAVNIDGVVKAVTLVEEKGAIKIVASSNVRQAGTLEATGNIGVASNSDININNNITSESADVKITADLDGDGIGSLTQSAGVIYAGEDGNIYMDGSGEMTLAALKTDRGAIKVGTERAPTAISGTPTYIHKEGDIEILSKSLSGGVTTLNTSRGDVLKYRTSGYVALEAPTGKVNDLSALPIKADYLIALGTSFFINSEAGTTHIIKDDTIYISNASRDDSSFTIEGGGFGTVKYLVSNNFTLQTNNDIATSPGVIIPGNTVTVIANKFGSSTTALAIDASNIHIQRTAGDIDILESTGIGTSILITGPPDGGFGQIIYPKSSSLSLEAARINVSEDTFLYASTLTLTANQEINLNGSIIVDGTFYLLSDSYITNRGLIQAKVLIEKSYHFTTTGAITGGVIYVDDIDGAGNYGGSIGSSINEAGDINVTSAITLTADNLTFTAGNDGSGAFISNGYALDSNTGANYNLTINVANDSTLGAIGATQALGSLTLGRSAGVGTPTFTMGGNMTLTGTLTIGANTILSAGSFALTVGGNWTHAGTITQSASISITGNYSQSSGTFTSNPTYTFSVGGSFSISGGTFSRFTGLGTVGDPYLIYDVYGLQAMKGYLSSNFKLANDIDASSTSNWNSAAGFEPVGTSASKFTGTFDGQNYTITELYINRVTNAFVGLFGYTGAGSQISNLGLVSVNITGLGGFPGGAGSLSGYNEGTITNSYASGSVSGNGSWYVGGLVGTNASGATISYSYASVAVSNTNGGGGLVGTNGGAIQYSYATGNVNGGASYGWQGGLVGFAGGTISNSYATGNVSGTSVIGGLVGGLWTGATISNSYATGSVTGTSEIGGLVGWHSSGTITNSYSTGSVSGTTNVGGLVGKDTTGSYTANYWDTQTSGTSDGVGNIPDPAGVTGKTTAQMKQQATFSGWNFSTTWSIVEDKTYPYLQWQELISGTVYSDQGTTLIGSGKNIVLVVNGSSVSNYNTNSDSTYYLLWGNLNSGDKLLVYLNNDAIDGNTVTIASGSNISGLDLYGSTVIVRHETAGPITNANLSSAKGSLSDTDIVYSVSGSTLDVSAGLRIWTGKTFAPGGDVSLSGNWANSGTFTAGASTVTYNTAAGGQTIGGVTYNNLTLSNTSGTDTAGGNLVVNGTLTTTAGGTLDMTSAYTLSGTLGTITGTGTITTAVPTATSAVPIASGKSWSGTIIYAAAAGAQTVVAGTYNNLTLSNTSGTDTVGGNLVVNGALTTTAGGTLDMVTYDLGVTNVTNGGTIRTQSISLTPLTTGKTWGGLVQYDAAGAQTIALGTYNNLTLGVSGAKTFPAGTTTVNGILSMEGTATATLTGALTYGAAATLQYNTATGRTAGAEWITPFAATGGIIIANTGTITMDGVKVLNASVPLTINSGATLGAGGFALTVGGNWTHAGTITQSASISITGNYSQSSGTFTSNPTYTFSVGGSFSISGGTFSRFTGLGTVGDPYLIYDVYGLQAMKGYLSSNFKLANDIDASSTSGWNSGAGFEPVGTLASSFTGTFNGNSYTISGLYISRSGTNDVGLFGATMYGYSISNVGMINVNVTGNSRVGGLSGYANSPISNCYVTGSVSGSANYVGGLIGYIDGGTVSNSYSTATVSGGTSEIGGLVGRITGSISNSYATGAVTAAAGSSYVGGLVGIFNGATRTVTNSYATGNVSGTNYVGGLAGWNYHGSISNSYTTGNVSGGNYVGGLFGLDDTSTISNSYTTGNVSGTGYVGGLMGANYSDTISNSYATGSVSGTTNVGGLVGWWNSIGSYTSNYWDTTTSGTSNGVGSIDPDPAGVTGKTTAQMKQQATFSGWDFGSNWSIVEDKTYPYLQWQELISGTVYSDQGSTLIGSGKNIVLVVNGLNVDNYNTASDSTYYLLWGNLNSGDKVLAYINNDAIDGNTVTIASGSSISGLNIYGSTVIVRHETAGPITNANLSSAKGSLSDADIVYSVSGSTLDVNANLLIWTGDTFAPGGDISLSGDWTNSGTFTADTSTVTYNGGSAQTVGAFSYNNLTLSGAGAKNAAGSITVGAILTNGSVLDMAGYTLALGTSTTNTGTVKFSGASNGVAITTGTVEYYGSSQTVATGTYVTLNLTNASTFTPNGAITATTLDNGGASNVAAILDMAGNTLTATTIENTGATVKFSGASNGVAIGTGTVEYYGSSQTVVGGTYNNLTLSTGGTKTLGAATDVTTAFTINSGVTFDPSSSLLSGAGTFTISGTAIVPGAAFSNNYTIAGAKTINAGSTFNYTNANPTINTGWTYQNLQFSGTGTAGASATLTVRGNLTNTGGGTLNFGAGKVILSGTVAANSIAGFTTTGYVAMTKTSGTATFTGAVNGGALKINGVGGTLNLGTGLTHTFTGIVTLTAGTLNGGSSTLNENMVSTTAWDGTGSLFTAGTGTVNFGAAGNQTLSATTTTFNNLTLSNSGVKTFSNANTVNGILSMEGTATATLTGALTYGANATLQYNTATARTAGVEWITPFAGTGGIIIANTGTITLNADKVLSASVPLTINSGAALDTGGFALTVGGNWTNNGGAFTAGSNTVTFNGTTQQTITTNSQPFYNLTLNNTGASGSDDIIISGALDVNGLLTITDGDLDVSTNDPSVNIAGGMTIGANGSIDLSGYTGVWTYDGSGTLTDNRAILGNLGTFTVDGTAATLTLGSNVKATSITVAADDTLNLGAGSYTLELTGSGTPLTVNGAFNKGTGSTVKYSGTSATNITTVAYNSLQLSGATTYSLTGHLTGGNALTGSLTIDNVAILDTTAANNYNIALSGNYSQSSGTFTANGSTITVGGNLTLSGGTFTSTSGTLSVGGNWDDVGGIFVHNSGTIDFTSASDRTFTTLGSQTYNNITHSGSGNLTLYIWQYRRLISIDHTKVPNVAAPTADYADFPILISTSGLSNINANGTDIRFTTSDGKTLLPREIESYSGGTLVAWVKMTLTKDAGDSSNDTLYMYYGNSSATEPAASSAYGSQNVWNSGFKGVWHMNDNAANTTVTESTSNGNTGAVQQNTSSLTIAGQDDGALTFNGTSDYVGFGNITAGNAVTISAWVNGTGGSGTWRGIAGSQGWTSGDIHFQINTNNVLQFAINNVTMSVFSTAVFNNTNYDIWYHVVGTYDGAAGVVKIYINGVNDGTGTGLSNITTYLRSPRIGSTYDNARYFNGYIDDVRISNTARSANWITAEYNNQSVPANFETVGAQGTNALTIAGNWTNNGGTFTPGTSTVTFNGTGAQAINGTASSQTFYNLIIAKTAGQTLSVSGSTATLTVQNLTETTGNFTAPATLNINGSVTLTAGTFTAGANTNVAGNWTNNGNFNHNNGVVILNGSGYQTIKTGGSGSAFNQLVIKNSIGITTFSGYDYNWYMSPTLDSSVRFTDALYTASLFITSNSTYYSGYSDYFAPAGMKRVEFAAGLTHTITNEFAVGGTSGKLVQLVSSVPGSAWYINPPAATNNIYFVFVSDSSVVTGKTMTANNSFNGGNDIGWTFGEVVFTGTGNWTDTAYWGSGYMPGPNDMLRISGYLTLNSTYSASRVTIDSGKTFNLSGYGLTTTEGIINSGTLILNGDEGITGSITNSAGSIVRYTGQGTYTELRGGMNYSDLEFSGGGRWTADGNIAVSGGFTVSGGIFELGGKSLTVSGDFTVNSGVFNGGTGIVKFTDASKVSYVHGTTFASLEIIDAGKQVVIDPGLTETITGNLTITGTADNPIVMMSSTPGQQWMIDPQSTTNISNLRVTDSNNISGRSITGTNIIDGGNNTNWFASSSAAVASTNTSVTSGENVLYRNQLTARFAMGFVEVSPYITMMPVAVGPAVAMVPVSTPGVRVTAPVIVPVSVAVFEEARVSFIEGSVFASVGVREIVRPSILPEEFALATSVSFTEGSVFASVGVREIVRPSVLPEEFAVATSVSFTEGSVFASVGVREIVRPSVLPEEFAVAQAFAHMNTYLPSFEEARVSFIEGSVFASVGVREIVRPSVLPEEFAVAQAFVHMNTYLPSFEEARVNFIEGSVFASVGVREIIRPSILPEEFALATSVSFTEGGVFASVGVREILRPSILPEEFALATSSLHSGDREEK